MDVKGYRLLIVINLAVDMCSYTIEGNFLQQKYFCSILNNIINVQIRQSFCKCVFVVNSPPKFAPTKVSLYTVSVVFFVN